MPNKVKDNRFSAILWIGLITVISAMVVLNISRPETFPFINILKMKEFKIAFYVLIPLLIWVKVTSILKSLMGKK